MRREDFRWRVVGHAEPLTMDDVQDEHLRNIERYLRTGDFLPETLVCVQEEMVRRGLIRKERGESAPSPSRPYDDFNI